MFLHFIKEFDFLFLILEHHSDSENFAVKRTEAQIVNLEQMIRLKLTRFLKVRGDAFFFSFQVMLLTCYNLFDPRQFMWFVCVCVCLLFFKIVVKYM